MTTTTIAAEPGYRGILFDQVWDRDITRVVAVDLAADDPIVAWEVPGDGSEPLPIGESGHPYWHYIRPDGSVVERHHRSWPDLAAFQAAVIAREVHNT